MEIYNYIYPNPKHYFSKISQHFSPNNGHGFFYFLESSPTHIQIIETSNTSDWMIREELKALNHSGSAKCLPSEGHKAPQPKPELPRIRILMAEMDAVALKRE